MATPENYIKAQEAYRKRFLQLQKKLEREYEHVNRKLMDKINKLTLDFANTDGTLDKRKRKTIQREIESITSWFRSETKDWLDDNIIKSANIAIEGQDKAAEYYIRGLIEQSATAERQILQRALDAEDGLLLQVRYGGGLAEKVRDIVWQHRWSDGMNLSERVWRLQEIADKNLKSIIQQGINQGKPATTIAKEAEKFLRTTGPKWTTGIKPAVTDKGSLSYNSLRMARTETNAAYHRAEKLGAAKSDIITGIKWNLSASHPVYPPSYEYNGYQEICDYYAKADKHGMGAGVFPPEKIPLLAHPQCLCYYTHELLQGEELINVLKNKYGGD